MIVLLVNRGFDLGYLQDADLISINRLIELTLKHKYVDKTEDAWTSAVAAAQDGKLMKKYVKQWRPFIEGDEHDDTDQKKLMADFGMGI